MVKPSVNLRLFVAVYPPVDVVRRCLDIVGGMGLGEYRLVAVEQVHLTLQFIGDTPAKRLNDVFESVERSVSGVGRFELSVMSIGQLPRRGRGKMVAGYTDGPGELLEVQRRLANRLARNRRERSGDRYLPHITLCRFRRPVGEGVVRTLDFDEGLGFKVEYVCLMRSILRSGGAEHIEVGRVELK